MSVPTCPSCIYAHGICEKTGVKIRFSTGCSYHKPKPITNADRIRAMTDEELADFLNSVMIDATRHGSLGSPLHVCGGEGVRTLEWLKQEASE